VTNAKTGQVLEGATVTMLDDNKNEVETKITSAGGETVSYLDCNKAYTIQAVKEGYEGGTFEMVPSKGGKTKIDAALRPIEAIITPTEIVLKEINFEFDKSNITREAAFELDKLVQVMKTNKELILFVKSHTDNRGDEKYNMELSQKRAKSTVQYVILKEIDASRITGKGFGESEPKADCQGNCTEGQHAQNRRSEFLIMK